MSVHGHWKTLANRRHAARKRRRLQSLVSPRLGERVMLHYAWDFAMCECPGDGRYSSQPILHVALHTREDGREIVRHPACGKEWVMPSRRRADRAESGVR